MKSYKYQQTLGMPNDHKIHFYLNEEVDSPCCPWCYMDLLHRVDGPAIEHESKYHCRWYINGKRFTGKWLQAYKRAKTQEKRDAVLGLWELNQEASTEI